MPNDNDWGEDEKTPIGATPFESLEHRSKSTSMAVGMLRVEQRRLGEGLKEVQVSQQRTNDRLDDVDKAIANVDKQGAVANAKLDLLVEDIRNTKKAVAHRERVTFETEEVVQRARIEESASVRKHSRERNIKILGMVGAALGTGGALTALIAFLAGKC